MVPGASTPGYNLSRYPTDRRHFFHFHRTDPTGKYDYFYHRLRRIIAAEMLRGRDYLIADNNLDSFLYAMNNKVAMAKDIPVLNLLIGNYGDEEMEATLDINSRSITNSQIIIAGATGSGKTNLLAVL